MIMGAVLAGGEARRFGSDKALAMVNGLSMLEIATSKLALWCERIVVVGREEANVPCLPDWPRAGMGPLGGIASALISAHNRGDASLMTIGVDSYGLPDDLPQQLGAPSACLASQPIVGHWRADDTNIAAIRAILQGSDSHSLRAFADAAGARRVRLDQEPANINTPADLAAVEKLDAL